MDIKKELEQVTRELEELEAQQVRLGARVRGLEAERDALAEVVRSKQRPHLVAGRNIKNMIKDDAILAVLQTSEEPMTVPQLTEALNSFGRNENAAGLHVQMQQLLRRRLVIRVDRGLYRAA